MSKGVPNWLVINSKAGTTTINHVTFKTFEIGDNWTSGGQDGPAYRTFHNGMCYELGIQTFTSRAEYDVTDRDLFPGRFTFTPG